MFTLAIIAIILISSTIAIQVQQPNPVKDYLIPKPEHHLNTTTANGND